MRLERAQFLKTCKILLLLLVCITALSFSAAAEEELHYFYFHICEQCTPQEDFANEFKRLTGQNLEKYKVVFHNVFHDRGRAEYEQTTAGWIGEEKQLPLLIMGGKAYSGTSSIAEGLQTQFNTRQQDHRSVVYFLTATACGSCERVRGIVNQHPDIIPIELNGRLISSQVEIIQINVSAQPEIAMLLFQQYAVPDEMRIAPMILMGDTYLAGEKAITDRFLVLLKSGAALNTPDLPHEPISTQSDAVSLWGAAAAGFTAGLNPCALSMLLVMTGMLLSIKRSILAYGSLYLAGKLAVYLLIGLVFAHLWVHYAPPWLPLIVKIIVTVIGCTLIIINLLDAVRARKEEYGQIRNQLPASFRKGLRNIIQRGISGSNWWLSLSSLALGMIVAAGEFLCAGQIYVAVLIANAQSGTMLPLVVYSAAFLVPSIMTLTIVGISRKTMDASDWMLRRMPMIKLLTALVMAAVLIYTWFA